MDGSINLCHRDGENIFLGGVGGAGGYNSTFTPDRGTEQQVKINGQVGLFTEGRGQLRKYSSFSGE